MDTEKSPAWSVQGLGQLRLYLTPNIRLHIWDSAFQTPNVSPIHTHPWHFTSFILAGTMRNQRYLLSEDSLGELWTRSRLKCGAGASLVGDPIDVRLLPQPIEVYTAGQSYSQVAHEIHRSLPDNGTLTLVVRSPLNDPLHADVFWQGNRWVDAAPRRATADEIEHGIAAALRKLREGQ